MAESPNPQEPTPDPSQASPPVRPEGVVDKRYFCDLPTPDRDLPAKFAEAVHRLEGALGLPVWLLVQGGPGGSDWDYISEEVRAAFLKARKLGLPRAQKVALLIDSRGGLAQSAYAIATILRRHCGGFIAIVPRLAKSAATLIALGADGIIMGEYAELGPIDVQRMDPERGEWLSGLDEVQSLERLNAFAVSALDQAMILLLSRTEMKPGTLLPHAIRFVTRMTGPLFSGIDVVRYTKMSRLLRVGEEYARMLLTPRLGEKAADDIARNLVAKYPEHEFIIDSEEAARLGLRPTKPSEELVRIMDEVAESLAGLTAIGRIHERGLL